MSINIDNLIKIGSHYGYTRTRRHPSVKKQIITSISRVDFINLDNTIVQYNNALAEMIKTIESGKQILFIGTKPEARQAVKEVALALDMPYIADRYIGGAITNFSEMRKRIEKLANLLKQKENGELDVYTKKERVIIQRDIDRLDRDFGGMSNMKGLPEIVFIIDSKKEHQALEEANKLGIKVIALTNTDCDINKVTHPIMCNEASVSVIKAFTEDMLNSLKNISRPAIRK